MDANQEPEDQRLHTSILYATKKKIAYNYAY